MPHSPHFLTHKQQFDDPTRVEEPSYYNHNIINSCITIASRKILLSSTRPRLLPCNGSQSRRTPRENFDSGELRRNEPKRPRAECLRTGRARAATIPRPQAVSPIQYLLLRPVLSLLLFHAVASLYLLFLDGPTAAD